MNIEQEEKRIGGCLSRWEKEKINAQDDDAYYLELKYFFDCGKSHRPIEKQPQTMAMPFGSNAARESMEKVSL